MPGRSPPLSPRPVLGVLLLGLLLASCGGGRMGWGHPEPLASDRQHLYCFLGESINREVPLRGGCGGPFVCELVAGEISAGLRIEDGETLRIVGTAQGWGRKELTLRVTDVGCTPFMATTFRLVISIGE